MSRHEFFVGYLPASVSVRRLGLVTACVFCLASVLVAPVLGRTGPEIGPSDFGEEISAEGVFVAQPYPMLIARPDAAHPNGRTFLLAGEGKRGAQEFGPGLDGRNARLQGILVKRGDIDMALVSAGEQLRRLNEAAPAPIAVSLGRWRIAGEICDGKCAAGGMRPGVGLAHKACANLCVSGGLPPVLVSAAPVAGRSHFLLGSADGGPVPTTVYDLMATPVLLEGELYRRGDLLVYLVDWKGAKRL